MRLPAPHVSSAVAVRPHGWGWILALSDASAQETMAAGALVACLRPPPERVHLNYRKSPY